MERTEAPFNRAEFDRVWQRVSPPETAAVAPTTAAQLSPITPIQSAAAAPIATPPASVAEIKVAAPKVIAQPVAETVVRETVVTPVAQASEVSPATYSGTSNSEVSPDVYSGKSNGEVSPDVYENNSGGVLGAATKEDTEIARLRDFMDRESEAARYYCLLAKRCRGQFARICRCLAEDCKCSIRALNAKYFIRTGEMYDPSSSVSPTGSPSEALRRACAEENRLYDDYLRAAETTNYPDLAELYTRCACAAQKRARTAERLLSCLMEQYSC
ncbi:MAG: hypothetical protein LBN30_02665 [Oscillospiraceae bacterium]|jgi:hypothetical protein|nr:hypothetical protein [Oscillospiraceae bacterium]